MVGSGPWRPILLLAGVVLALAPAALAPRAVAAATLTFAVTGAQDAHDATPGDGACAASTGQCTLRAAIEEANAQAAGSTITIKVPAGIYALTLGALAIGRNTVIVSGAGPSRTVVTAGGLSQILRVAHSSVAALIGLALTGGNAGAATGGGLANSGTTLLIACAVVNNTATRGGGISNATGAVLALESSAVLSNTTAINALTLNGGNGGGIWNGGTLYAISGTISGNSSGSGGYGNANPAGSGGNGGGIWNGGTLSVGNSTLSGNGGGPGGPSNCGYGQCGGAGSQGMGGGLLAAGGSAALSYATVAANADGLDDIGGTVTVTGTILANGGPNCSGVIGELQGYNLESGATCGFAQTTDLTQTNPLLGPLALNGGATATMAVPAGSPAIDHGGTQATGCPATDQRGLPRPDEVGDGGACDIGAYESQGLG